MDRLKKLLEAPAFYVLHAYDLQDNEHFYKVGVEQAKLLKKQVRTMTVQRAWSNFLASRPMKVPASATSSAIELPLDLTEPIDSVMVWPI